MHRPYVAAGFEMTDERDLQVAVRCHRVCDRDGLDHLAARGGADRDGHVRAAPGPFDAVGQGRPRARHDLHVGSRDGHERQVAVGKGGGGYCRGGARRALQMRRPRRPRRQHRQGEQKDAAGGEGREGRQCGDGRASRQGARWSQSRQTRP